MSSGDGTAVPATPGGPPVPAFLYGTAWKEDETARLTRMALDAGFRGIDTANQRRHYHEAGVGAALTAAVADGVVRREDVFLQTKFTHVAGQDHRLPYDPHARPAEQVRQSFRSSLEHLGVESIDSYVLHGPATRFGLHPVDVETWAAMEELHDEGLARHLGVSNVGLDQLEELCARARVPPAFVQDRCFARLGWNRAIRAACRERGIAYQGFSLLTANAPVLQHPEIARIAGVHACTPAQVIFAFAIGAGMLPLSGTTDPHHARQDLGCLRLRLTDEEIAVVDHLAG
jgi:diketogulonate reductase-like aldo/keto reductase